MNINFAPRLLHNPLAAIGAGIGGLQAIIGGINARKAQKKLEKLEVPTYGGSESIKDYYNKALQRFNTNPYQSQLAQYSAQQADRSQAAGLGALQGRGSAVGGVSRLAALRNDAALRTGVQAEQMQNQRFGELGQATEMQTGDDIRQFQQNKLAPYEKKYNLLSMKAGAANQMANAGLNNIFGGLAAGQDYKNIKKTYSTNTDVDTSGY